MIIAVATGVLLGSVHVSPTLKALSTTPTTICNYVFTALRVNGEGPTSLRPFKYQQLFLQAAGVLESDDRATVRRKMQVFWDREGSKITCNVPQFPRDGSLTKLAVQRRLTHFIEDVTVRWQVDLNRIDAGDGRTILDFTADEITRLRGTPGASTIRRYFDLMKAAGALHRYEIDGVGCREATRQTVCPRPE